MEDLVNKRKLVSVGSRLLVVVSVLVCLGVILIYSASCVRAGRSGLDYFFVKKQLLWLGLGMGGMYIASRFNLNWLRRLAVPLCLLVYSLLALVLVPGIGAKVNGAARWLRFGGYNMQPSEFAKIGMVLVIAAFLARFKEGDLPFFRGFLPVMGIIGIACGLIMMEPDFGTAALTGAVLLGMVIIGGARMWQVALMMMCALPPAVFIGLTKFDYIMERVNVWLQGDKSGKGYQIWMSKVALGSGGLTGMGLGEGVSKLYYLPEAHTDFVFAIAGQELGLCGTLFIIILFSIFVYEGLQLVRYAPDRFCALCAFGFTGFIGLQAAFNIAVVTASVPPKGISLPFISFGGSGLCSALISIGLMLAIVKAGRRKAQAQEQAEVIEFCGAETEQRECGKDAA